MKQLRLKRYKALNILIDLGFCSTTILEKKKNLIFDATRCSSTIFGTKLFHHRYTLSFRMSVLQCLISTEGRSPELAGLCPGTLHITWKHEVTISFGSAAVIHLCWLRIALFHLRGPNTRLLISNFIANCSLILPPHTCSFVLIQH